MLTDYYEHFALKTVEYFPDGFGGQECVESFSDRFLAGISTRESR